MFPGQEDTLDSQAKYYLIVGAFRELANAKSFQKIIKREGSIDSKVIQNDKQTWFLIYTEEIENPRQANKRIKALEKSSISDLIVGTPWIFKKKKLIDLGLISTNRIFRVGIILLLLAFSVLETRAQDLESVKDQNLFDWSGGIGLTTTFYNVSGLENRRDPFFWQLNANLNLSFLGGIVNAPFSFVVSQQNKNFSQPQPFNRFGLSPTYREWTLHLGHRSMNFSDYTLAGNIFYGVGLEYKSDNIPWRASAMYGRLSKAVERSASAGVTFVEPSFRRLGYGTKVGYHKNKQEIDLIFFRAYDDLNSIGIRDSPSNISGGKCGIGTGEQASIFQEF